MNLRRVVVTGIGAITPIGNTAPDYFDALKKGVSGAAPITYFDASKFKTRFACEVKNFEPTKFFEKKELRKLDPYTVYSLVSSDEAILDSGLENYPELNRNRVGVIWGSGYGGCQTFYSGVSDYVKGGEIPRYSPFFIPMIILDIAAGQISIRHGFRGLNFAVCSACATSTNSIIDAFNYIRWGRAEAIITGGSEFPITPPSVGGFSSARALSERNDDPQTASRPYDKDRDGFVVGEGACALVLEELEHAKARGAKIYCEVIGGGMSADAYHITAPHPDGIGVDLVLKDALQDAEIDPSQVDYMNAHGTSTPLGDFAEIKAIKTVFGEHIYKMNISSTKSMTGHMLGAAGGAEALACILAITENIIPPTINHFTDDPEIDAKINLTFNKAQQRTVNIAMSNTFGFSGHNASVVMKKYAS